MVVAAEMAAYAAVASFQRDVETPLLRHPGHTASHNILAAQALHALVVVLAVLRFPQTSLVIQYFLIGTAMHCRTN